VPLMGTSLKEDTLKTAASDSNECVPVTGSVAEEDPPESAPIIADAVVYAGDNTVGRADTTVGTCVEG
jgi:hypothetical protein